MLILEKKAIPQSVFKYGIEWQPYTDASGTLWKFEDYLIEQQCFFNREHWLSRGAKLDSPLEHFKRLVSCYWPTGTVGQFLHNRFSDALFDCLINHEYIGLRGSSSAGKTYCACVWVLMRFNYYRENYSGQIFTTHERGHRDRSWKDLMRLMNTSVIPMFGYPSVADMEIRASMDGSALGIKCKNIQKNSDIDAEVSALSGAHGASVVDMVLEEADGVRESVFAASLNIFAGVPDCRFIAICNPVRKTDFMGKFCQPVDGYDAFDIMRNNSPQYGFNHSVVYKTKAGISIRFDGRDSPGFEDPNKYGKFLTKKTIEHFEKMQDVTPLMKSRFHIYMGWMVDENAENNVQVISDSDVSRCLIEEPADFDGKTTLVCGIDAGGSGPDKKVLWIAEVGQCDIDGKRSFAIMFREPHIITSVEPKVNASYFDELASKMASIIKASGVKPQFVSIDISGTNDVFREILSKKLGVNFLIHGTHFNQWPEERYRRISVSDGRDSKDICDKPVTELHVLFQEFMRRKQIRAAHPTYVAQLIKEGKSRMFLMEGKNGKKAIETKHETISRLGYSPNHLDAALCVCNVVRQRLNIFPGSIDERRMSLEYQDEGLWDMLKNRIKNIRINVNRAHAAYQRA